MNQENLAARFLFTIRLEGGGRLAVANDHEEGYYQVYFKKREPGKQHPVKRIKGMWETWLFLEEEYGVKEHRHDKDGLPNRGT